MSLLDVRVLPTALPTAPFPRYWGPKLVADPPLTFSVTRFALANATALPKPNPYTIGTLLAETALQISHLDTRPGTPLRLVSSFNSSSSHIRRFVAEATGLGICTAVAHQRCGWGGRILNFDSLRTSHWLVAGIGPRPDLAYGTPIGGWVAGEASGRTDASRDRMSVEEFDRTVALNSWASRVGRQPNRRTPKWFMTWSYLTQSETKVHYYDPGHPFHISDAEAADFIHPVEQALWASEEIGYGRLHGVSLRGGWRDASPLSEPRERTWLFVGVLAEPIDDLPYLELLQVLSEQDPSAFGGVEWCLTGRLVCVLARGGDNPPDAAALAELLEDSLRQVQIERQRHSEND